MGYKPTYWNNKGKFEKELYIISEKYYNDHNKNNRSPVKIDKKLALLIGYTRKEIERAEKAIRELMKFYDSYCSFYQYRGKKYNTIKWKGKTFNYETLTESEMKFLDKILDKLIEKAWKAIDKGRMPFVQDKVFVKYL